MNQLLQLARQSLEGRPLLGLDGPALAHDLVQCVGAFLVGVAPVVGVFRAAVSVAPRRVQAVTRQQEADQEFCSGDKIWKRIEVDYAPDLETD